MASSQQWSVKFYADNSRVGAFNKLFVFKVLGGFAAARLLETFLGNGYSLRAVFMELHGRSVRVPPGLVTVLVARGLQDNAVAEAWSNTYPAP